MATLNLANRTTRLAKARPSLDLAALITLALSCSARLAVSDETLADDTNEDAGAGGGSQPDENAGAGGGSTANETPDAGASSSCQDRVRNGRESDLDCGGPDCPTCPILASCSVHADCQSSSCRGGLCRAPACDDDVKNGDETSVDCGGATCRRCVSNTCNCASSPELTALECDETNGFIFPGGPAMITPDGDAAVFMICHSEVFVSGTPVCSTFRWTSAGSERIATLGTYGMSRDGRNVLLQENDANVTPLLLEIGGETTPVPLHFPLLFSSDGATLVGIEMIENAPTLQRWSRAGGLETLAQLEPPGGSGAFQVSAVNSDGSAITGFVESDAGDLPFLWTDAGGLVRLGPIPEDARGARPGALSDDGSVVAGITTGFAADGIGVFRWTASGLEILAPAQTQDQSHPSMPGPGFMAMTSDGAVIAATIGYPEPGSFSAWRYSTTDGATILSAASPGVVHDMTPDGTTLIGMDGADSVKWILQPPVAGQPPQFSTVKLATALQSKSVDLTNWELEPPTSISDDGRVMFGGGTCGGVPTLYRLVLEP